MWIATVAASLGSWISLPEMSLTSGVVGGLPDQVNEAMQIETSDPPEGMILHSAGPMPDGWYIYDIWESREHFQRFAQERVAPAVQQVTGSEMSGEPQFFEIANLVLAGQKIGRAHV